MADADPGAFVELQFDVDEDAADVVAACVGDLAEGVEIRDQETILRADPGRAIVVGLVVPAEAQAVIDAVMQALDVARAAGVTVDPVLVRQRETHEDEWRDVWKQFFRATRMGRSFLVRPSWDPGAGTAADHVIDLDPGRAFGTGAHPSTRLVVSLAEDAATAARHRDGTAVAPVGRFLDLGCGSGILAIAATRLWPKARGLAVDIDAESVACARENFERNQVTSVDSRPGTIADCEGPFDLVLANILMDVLLAVAADTVARLAPGGRVILSGLLGPQADTVAAHWALQGLLLDERRDEGEWSALLLHRR